MIGEFLLQITRALEMHGVPYMLTGSLASSMYGIPRATNDIDVVIAPTRDQLLSVVQLFQRQRSLKVDLIIRKDREFSVAEFDRRETQEVEGMRLTLATPEDVLLAKLE